MKYTLNGKTTDYLPDPCNGVSPMTDERFVQMGGVIEPGPKEHVCAAFADLVADLAQKTEKITPAEFLAAAQNGISSDLIAFARARSVPESVIAEGRARIVEIMADALRFGVSWAELISGVSEA